jgi:hypothetical protein
MLRQLRVITTEAEPSVPTGHRHEAARCGPSGPHVARVDVERGRVPGPLPTLDRIDQIDRRWQAPAPTPTQAPGSAPAPALARVAVAAVNEPVTSPDRLMPLFERLRSPLKVGFTVSALLDLPFIIYVLCWRVGFDLTSVTYPLLTLLLGGSTIAVWVASHRLGSRQKIGVLLARSRIIPWMSLEVFPIVGFVMWRDGGLGSMNRLIPLLVVALAFVFSVGLPTAPSEISTRARHLQEGTTGKLPQMDRSRALSRW